MYYTVVIVLLLLIILLLFILFRGAHRAYVSSREIIGHQSTVISGLMLYQKKTEFFLADCYLIQAHDTKLKLEVHRDGLCMSIVPKRLKKEI